MNNRQNNMEQLDELFLRKLGTMEMSPPGSAWQQIAADLDRRERFGRRFWWVAASIALLVGVAGTLWLLSPSQPETPQLAEEETPVTTDKTPANNAKTSVNTEATTSSTMETPVTPVTPSQTASSTTKQHSILILSKKKSDVTETSSVAETQTTYSFNTASVASAFFRFFDTDTRYLAHQQRDNAASAFLAVPTAMPAEPQSTPSTVAPLALASPNYDRWDDDWDPFGDSKKNEKTDKRWSLAGQLAPTVSYRTVTEVPDGMRRSDFNNAESALIAYSGGLNVSYQVHKRWSIQTGVYYTQMGQTIHNVVSSYNMYAGISSTSTYSKNFLRTSSGTAAVSSNLKAQVDGSYADYFNDNKEVNLSNASLAPRSSQNTMIERLDYIEIPMLMRYRLIDRTFGLTLLGGMGANILVGNNVLIDNGEELIREGPIQNARPVNYNSTFGFGINYQATKNLLIGIEPVFKYFLQSYSSGNTVTAHPYSFGLFTGVYYSF